MNYNRVTNKGADEVGFTFENIWWWYHLSSPSQVRAREGRLVGLSGQLSQDVANKAYHGARSAFYRIKIIINCYNIEIICEELFDVIKYGIVLSCSFLYEILYIMN